MIGRALRLALLLAVAAAAAPTLAQQAETETVPASEPLTVLPGREGYAFDSPRILAQQRLIGVAHGVSLLVSACIDQPAHAGAALTAYQAWRDGEEAAINLAQRELAQHYFDTRANEAGWIDLLRALNLKNQLDLASGSAELEAACTTLPEALRKPRYALGRQLELQGLLAEVTAGLEAELRREWCRPRLEGDALRLFDVRYDTWRNINVLRLARAQRWLKDEWPVEAPAESLDQWQQLLRAETKVSGRPEDCLDFSEKLKRPQAALRTLFVPPSGAPR